MEKPIQHLVELRQWLHANPEISGDEKNTSARVTDFLRTLSPDRIITHIGGYGIMAMFDSGNPGSTVLFRADMDALPIQETNVFAHRSITDGVSHKCGHDGHTTILCGLAERLSVEKPVAGKVYLLFQPAEETGEGAARIEQDPKFDIKPDYVFALHNLPGYESGQIVVRDGLFSAAVNSMVIKLTGKTAHAAEPEFGFNPAKAVSEIIRLADELNFNNPSAENFQLLTPVHINLGSKAYGISAGEAELHYTLRCWNNENLRNLENQLIDSAGAIAAVHNLQCRFEFTQTFFANNNNPDANDLVRLSARQNNLVVEEKNTAFKWAEDFGYFTSKYPGCMFGLGAGKDQPALHNPDYDFPDCIISSGINIFHSIIKNISAK